MCNFVVSMVLPARQLNVQEFLPTTMNSHVWINVMIINSLTLESNLVDFLAQYVPNHRTEILSSHLIICL